MPTEILKVRDMVLVGLGCDEIFHIGMVDAQDRHIGATACIMRHHTIRKISMVVCNLKIQCERLSGSFHAPNFHEPHAFHRGCVFECRWVRCLEQLIA